MRSHAFNIPDYWTDEQALVMFEFIDGIRDQIWDHYCLQIQSAAKTTRHITIGMEHAEEEEEQADLFDDQIPF